MTEKKLKKIMLANVGDMKYWLFTLMQELEEGNTDINKLDWITNNLVNYSVQFRKFVGWYEMLESAEKENGK